MKPVSRTSKVSSKVIWLAGREGRRLIGDCVPVTEFGLRVGIDNIGESFNSKESVISR